MAYTNKTYVAFDADNDMRYYRLMQARKHNDNTSFNFYDAHDLNNLMSRASEDTIKWKLNERLNNTKTFILLVWEKTKYLYKFVRWEIEQAIKKDIPIIVVNLNGKRSIDWDNCPPLAKDNLSVHISFNQKIIEHAINNRWYSHGQYKSEWKSWWYYYLDSVYQNLWL